ncbi:lipid kinase YegS [bioreactor metagenome]|uniref:Lipid kinase YegS n=1 Tax=bioreactor metagenome TaxID=1076179 RepID=A0A645IX94_9ZZZZ
MTFDDTEVKKGDILLVLAANGMVCGGGFYGAPRARINDGLMDVCIFDRVSRIKFLSLMDKYKKGSHVGNPAFEDFMVYRNTKSLRVSSTKEITLSCDGECERVSSVEITVKKESLKMILPRESEIISSINPSLMR